jgi:uncharacterized protein (DUF305 family)
MIIFSFLISASFVFSYPTIVQPGAPEEASKTLDPQAASNILNTSYIKADVKFLQGMIIHHKQAILLSSIAYPELRSRIFSPQQQIPMSWPNNASE